MTWEGLARRLEGEIVVLEPLEARHEVGLWAASQHPEVWTWTIPRGKSPQHFQAWFQDTLAACAAGDECVFAKFEGIFRRHMIIEGVGVRDSAYYSVIDEDWPKVRANLEHRLAATRA
jgi:hypothetical protein